jgi:hypothetical protein
MARTLVPSFALRSLAAVSVTVAILASFALGATAALAGGLPERLVLVYSLTRGTLELGRIEETFERRDNRYTLTSEARATGVAALLARGQGWRRESQGEVTADGLRPSLYSDQRGANPVQRARLDWPSRTIRFERAAAAGATEPAVSDPETLAVNTTDRLSFPYSLAQRATLPTGEFDVPMTDGRRVTLYRFTVIGRESLRTPAGSFEAIRISRVRGKDGGGTDIWLALDRQLIPLRILVTENDGTTFDQVLVQVGPP